ncbi:tetratricopeptide repeat protein [Undibacterium sp. Jales W-56]|uniref:YfgM family protein n=1 Tax=Undibacterium sp. Jales W-56 TaxID=2897325 RepID=UPI0021CE7F09|nr:tetratricopeptide repeat protein [Undibacterium sp. Jales W-56]MCU6433168.1 tetratricopeptide repeat protein [Undibacterium sp. Jales W-56]
MAYDLEEQEQLDTLKAWWKQYGNLVTWSLVIALSAYAAWTGWTSYQRNQSNQASQLYDEMQKAVQAKDNAKVQRAANDLIDKFGKTPYAAMSALTAAKSAFDANDAKSAKAQLRWVVEHSSVDEYKSIARIRLAGLALDEKAYDEGLSLLSGDFPAEFAGDVADRKGDIYLAQNKTAEARAAFQTALDKLKEKNPGRQLIQLKLDALGGTEAKVAGNSSAASNSTSK